MSHHPHPSRVASALRLARTLAQQAHDEDFASRRRVVHDRRGRRIAIANNNPYANDPKAREAELERFRAWCAGEGIAVLAEATYPTSGPDADYTHVIVVDVAAAPGVNIGEAYAGCLRHTHGWWDAWQARQLTSTAPQHVRDAVEAALLAGATHVALAIASDRETWVADAAAGEPSLDTNELRNIGGE